MVPRNIRDEHVARGQVKAFRSGPLLIIKYHDKKVVHMLTTHHTEETVRVQPRQRNQGPVYKPLAITQYNRYMGGVDLQDMVCTCRQSCYIIFLYFTTDSHFLAILVPKMIFTFYSVSDDQKL